MLDPLAQQIAAISLGVAAGVSAVLKFLPGFINSFKAHKSEPNGKFTYYQELQVREIVRLATEQTRLANENALADLRNLIAQRTDTLRDTIKSEIANAKKDKQ